MRDRHEGLDSHGWHLAKGRRGSVAASKPTPQVVPAPGRAAPQEGRFAALGTCTRIARAVSTALALLAVAAVWSTVAACTSAWRDHGSLVEPGMREAEVVELLGEPSSRVDVPAFGDRPAYVRWQWNDNLSTLATGAMFPDTVPDRVLAVIFDADGRVVEVVEPRPGAP